MAFYFFYFIKMDTATDDGQMMLPRQGGDPQIILRNGPTHLPQFLANVSVMLGGFAVNGKNFKFLHSFSQPCLIRLTMT